VRAAPGGPRGGGRDVAALAAARRGRGPGVHSRAGVPRLPHSRAAPQALRGGGAGDRGHARARAGRRAGRRGGRHPHARPGARRRARGRTGRDPHPPHRPAPASRLPAVLGRRAAAAHARRARQWAATEPLVGRGLELGRGELNETRARSAWPAQDHVHGGSRAGCRSWRRSPSSSTPGAAAGPAGAS
jgi:hypothetical protein